MDKVGINLVLKESAEFFYLVELILAIVILMRGRGFDSNLHNFFLRKGGQFAEE